MNKSPISFYMIFPSAVAFGVIDLIGFAIALIGIFILWFDFDEISSRPENIAMIFPVGHMAYYGIKWWKEDEFTYAIIEIGIVTLLLGIVYVWILHNDPDAKYRLI